VGCATIPELTTALAGGAGAVLIAEEALPHSQTLINWIDRQENWSDLPILVLARVNSSSTALAGATRQLGNVTILARPVSTAELISSVRTALRARRRQYQIRQHLSERAATEEQLRLNDQRKDEFLAILAHELRNPLAPVSNALQILRPWLADHAQALALIEMMERQVRNLTRLVDDLLEVSRVTRGDLVLHPEVTSVGALIDVAVESSRPLIGAANHELALSVPAEPILLYADPVRLAQVISNLLNNAAKYTPRGGKICVAVRRDGDDAVIDVEDNGTGIPVADQDRIFELFTQVERNRDRAQGGLGIGLTLVKRLVEMHAGSVAVYSEGPGKGSRFSVRLPAYKPDIAPVARQRHDADADLSAIHAVVADDNVDAADSLGALLELLGAKVSVAYDGQQALAAAVRDGINVAILDIGMPGMDGLEVARRIRERRRAQPILLIALTGWGQQEDIQSTRLAGFDVHLTKPVDFAVLMKALNEVTK
jgi:signal transduction histidine kinase/CheY-like chemotaxis protein